MNISAFVGSLVENRSFGEIVFWTMGTFLVSLGIARILVSNWANSRSPYKAAKMNWTPADLEVCQKCGGIRAPNLVPFSGVPCLCDERHVDFDNGHLAGYAAAFKAGAEATREAAARWLEADGTLRTGGVAAIRALPLPEPPK